MNINLELARTSLNETIAAISALKDEELSKLASILDGSQKNESFIWTAGNGGSASTAAHLACDIGKGVGSTHDKPFRTLAINEQSISQSAWANDEGYENAIVNQLKNLAKAGDTLLCISGSGNSKNIVNASQYASENGITVVCLVGRNGGAISKYADFELRVDSTDMQVLENVHLVIVHWLFKALVKI